MAQSISNLALGSKVKFNGVAFTVIAKNHYSTDEVTLLAEAGIRKQMHSSEAITDFASTDLLYYLNNTYINTLHTDLQSAIKTTTIPYCEEYTSTASREKTVNAKVFLLSLKEAGISNTICGESTKEKAMSYLKSGGRTLLASLFPKYAWTRANYYNSSSSKIYYFGSISAAYDYIEDGYGIKSPTDEYTYAHPVFNVNAGLLVSDNAVGGYYIGASAPPVIKNISNINSAYGQATTIQYTATDSDSTSLTHYISFNNGSTFTKISPTKSGNKYTYSHVFNSTGTYNCRVKVVDAEGNSTTSNGFTVTVSGVAPTVNIISVIDTAIEFKVNCTTHDISKVEVSVNDSIVKTYTDGFNSNLTYDIDKSILNTGKNSIQIKATSTGSMIGYKDLEANKTTYDLPTTAGTKVVIGDDTYTIINASMNGSNHVYMLDKALSTPVSKGQEIHLTQDFVKVLCSLSNTESHKDFKEMKLVNTKPLKGQFEGYIEEKYELEGEGRYSTIKLETERFLTSIASEIIELQQYFDYMED